VELGFLEPLYAEPAPVACAYLDTSRDIDDPDKAIELRWRHLRDQLTAQGADAPTVAALADAVGTDQQVSGRHGQAIFAQHGRVLLAEELPNPPVRETARYTPLPDALPLAVQHAPDIPYVAVAISRVNHRGTSTEPEELDLDFQAGRWPASSVAPETCHRRRVTAADWPREAARIAEEVASLAQHSGAERIILCGDSWARGVLAHRMPKHLRDHLAPGAHDGQREEAEAGRALLESQLRELFQRATSERDRTLVGEFHARRARQDGQVEGMAAVVAALQRGQAKTMLLNTPVELPAPLWAGPEPTQLALSEEDLRSFGVHSPQKQPAGAALIRALTRTGGELIVLPREDLPLAEGIAVLPRYADSPA
jgi:hypothetical protein